VIAADGKRLGAFRKSPWPGYCTTEGPAAVKIGDVMARRLPTLDVTPHWTRPIAWLLAGYTGVPGTSPIFTARVLPVVQ